MVNYPSYTAPNWQSTICVLGVVVVSGVFNIFLSDLFPLLNNISMVLHIMGFVAVVVVLCQYTLRSSATTLLADV